MDGSLRMTRGTFWRLGNRGGSSRRIIVGLKSDTCSREMLLRLLQFVVARGDSVLAVHVQQHSDDTFDANTFHIYEDVCKSKQVDFEVKICSGSCYVAELAHQVRVTFATTLALGCSSSCPEASAVAKCLKALPPTCKLLIMDSGGRILLQQMGTSQQGSSSRVCRTFVSSLSESSSSDPHLCRPQVRKSWSMPSSSTASTSEQAESGNSTTTAKNSLQPHDFAPRFFQRSVVLEEKVHDRCFTYEELNHATDYFGGHMLIGEDANSRLYKAVLEDGQAAAVKVLIASQDAEDVFLRELEVLSGLKHENAVELVGYCYCKEMCAVVYNFCDSRLKQKLNQLKWCERMQVALGVARAIDYLHSCHPPIIHTHVNSSNILLLEDGRPQLSDFGAAIVHLSANRSSARRRPVHVVETLRYLAPEYIMYGKVDEKVDVYAYGILLLELITGKEATRSSRTSKQESLLLWARSLLTCGLDERLIDPGLNEDYNTDEMKAVMIIARLCLLHSSSRRPKMKTILQFLEEPNYVLEIQRKSGDLPIPIHMEPEDENDCSRLAKSDSSDVSL